MLLANENLNDDELVDYVIREHDRLAGGRGIWESHWNEIAERVWPSMWNSFNANQTNTAGQKVNQLIFDPTATVSLNRFAAIMDSLLTPRNSTWHRIVPIDPILKRNRLAVLWYEDLNRVLFRYRYAPQGNFASQNSQNYKSLGAFGTGCMYIDALVGVPENGIRYKNVGLGEVHFRENHQGIIDSAFRYFPLRARQAMQKWGDKCPDQVKDAAKDKPDQEFHFIHVAEPNVDIEPGRIDFRGRPIRCIYVCKETRTLLEQDGYYSFPYAISRYEQSQNETYGRSPAMDVLPAVKTLNEKAKTLLKQGHRTVDPVLLAYDDGVIDAFSLKPGDINYGGVDKQGNVLVHPLPIGRVDVGREMMEDDRNIIKDAFLVSLFQILVENPTMTATEVMERVKEKGILLAPTFGRQQSEYLGPMVQREIDVLQQRGLLPPAPQIVQQSGGHYMVEYDSPLSRAQRAEEASGLMRTVETAINVATQTQNPEPLDWFDWDAIIPDVASIQGVPAKWMKDIRTVQALRAGRQEAQQRQEMMQAAPGAAAVIKSTAVANKAGALPNVNR